MQNERLLKNLGVAHEKTCSLIDRFLGGPGSDQTDIKSFRHSRRACGILLLAATTVSFL